MRQTHGWNWKSHLAERNNELHPYQDHWQLNPRGENHTNWHRPILSSRHYIEKKSFLLFLSSSCTILHTRTYLESTITILPFISPDFNGKLTSLLMPNLVTLWTRADIVWREDSSTKTMKGNFRRSILSNQLKRIDGAELKTSDLNSEAEFVISLVSGQNPVSCIVFKYKSTSVQRDN